MNIRTRRKKCKVCQILKPLSEYNVIGKRKYTKEGVESQYKLYNQTCKGCEPQESSNYTTRLQEFEDTEDFFLEKKEHLSPKERKFLVQIQKRVEKIKELRTAEYKPPYYEFKVNDCLDDIDFLCTALLNF